MNSTFNTQADYHWIKPATFIMENYAIRTIGGLGILINLLFTILLLHKSLVHKMYDFFWCRAICSFLVCLFAAGNVERCFNCVSDSYWYLVYQFFINSIGLRLFSAASLFSDIFLMLNRYLEITRKKSCISRMSKTLVLYICICTPLPFAIPGLFLVKIVEGPQKGTFVKKAIDPPATPNLVLYYTELIFLFETVLPVFF